MILTKTPLRIGFFGGGTDLDSFTKKEFGCVISTTIDKNIFLVAHPSFCGNNIVVYKKREVTDNVEDIENTRIRAVMKQIGIEKGIEIHSLAEVPAGTGLGSSSSFTVGLLNLLKTYKHLDFKKEDIAEEACYIEREELKEPIGKQDQYAAAFGGFNFMRFNMDGSVEVIPINTRPEIIQKIESRIILFYLDSTREAKQILSEQNKEINGNNNKFEMMKKIKDIALKMKQDLENNNLENFGKMLHESWMIKKGVSGGISNKFIDDIYEQGLKIGAEGGKLLGAGGGGFILFYGKDPNLKSNLIKKFSNLKYLDIKFEKEGTKNFTIH